MPDENKLFPVFLKLANCVVVVVGAGSVASSKLNALVNAGANVRVVAPDIGPNVVRPGVSITRRAFRPDDLDGAWLAVAAATPEVNHQVAAAALARRIFVNAVDDPVNASAYLGGVVRRGGVTFSISTDGRAPALAGILREGLEAMIPTEDLERWMADAKRMRNQWLADGVPMNARRPLLLEALLKRYAQDGVSE